MFRFTNRSYGRDAAVGTAPEENLRFETDKVRYFTSQGDYCSELFYSFDKQAFIPCTVSYDRNRGSVMLAFSDGGKQISAIKIMKKIFGPMALGRNGMALSPRGIEYPERYAFRTAEYVEAEYLRMEAFRPDGRISCLKKWMTALKIQRDIAKEMQHSNPFLPEERTPGPAGNDLSVRPGR